MALCLGPGGAATLNPKNPSLPAVKDDGYHL